MAGPARFGELHDRLPGIATNLLTSRLRDLEESGIVVRRTLNQPEGTVVYELTASGRALGPAMQQLMLWGVQFISETDDGPPANARSWVTGLSVMASTASPDGLNASVRVRIGECCEFFMVTDGRALIYTLDEPNGVEATITMNQGVMMEMARGALAPTDAMDHSDVSVGGDRAAAQVFFEVVDRVRLGLGAAPSPDEAQPATYSR